MRKTLTLLVLIPCLVFSVAGKKDKSKGKKGKKGAKVELVGWQPVGEAGGMCYHAPKFEGMVDGPRRIARSEAIQGILDQWRGGRDDGVKFPEKLVVNVENVLLGDPADIEAIVAENLVWCTKNFEGGGSAGWQEWATGLTSRLTAGECKGSLLPQEMHDYLNLSSGWHMNMGFCKGETVRIEVSNKDFYRVDEGGPWINADGDPDQKASGDYPCTSDCNVGQVIMRFQNDAETIDIVKPVGSGTLFTLPDHGTIWVRINDKTPVDNAWKVEKGLQHHAGVSYMDGSK